MLFDREEVEAGEGSLFIEAFGVDDTAADDDDDEDGICFCLSDSFLIIASSFNDIRLPSEVVLSLIFGEGLLEADASFRELLD